MNCPPGRAGKPGDQEGLRVELDEGPGDGVQ